MVASAVAALFQKKQETAPKPSQRVSKPHWKKLAQTQRSVSLSQRAACDCLGRFFECGLMHLSVSLSPAYNTNLTLGPKP
jgi:hypothetical protein